MAINVESLQGSGDYYLSTKIIGTTAHLAAEAVLNRADVLLAISCRWFDDCTFTYDGLQQRADGASFLLRFPAAAGLTYKFAAVLQAGLQSGTHLRLAISPDGSIGTASTERGQPGQGDEVCVGLGRIVALCHQTHPFYTRFASIFGTSKTETTMRPNPRCTAGSRRRGCCWRPARTRASQTAAILPR